MEVNELSNVIIGMAIDVHSALGPGLLESAYKECLFYKIQKEGFYVDVKLDCGYRMDILVENKLVLELKCVEKLTDLHLAQTLTYLKLGNFRLGLLMNFNSFLLKDGLRRVVNRL